MNQPFTDRDELAKAARLFLPPGTVCEVRALDAILPGANGRYPSTLTGYFSDQSKLIDEVCRIQSAIGVYCTMNPVDPQLLARAANRLKKPQRGESTSDKHITHRVWMLVDVDPQRATGISSTDAEHEAAFDRARRIFAYLRDAGWPEPVTGDSGNGCHLLYSVNLPADDGGLIQRCLQSLDKLFSDIAVKVDTTVFNEARIVRCYGTLTAKGDSTPDRPHRMSRLVHVPDDLQPVPRELLEALAAQGDEQPQPESSGPTVEFTGSFDLEDFIRQSGLNVDGPEPWDSKGGRGERWVLAVCPFNSDHTDRAAWIGRMGSGAIAAGCQHDSCTWGWRELRQRFDPDYKPGEKQSTRDSGKPAGDDDRPERKSQSTLLVELAQSASLWHTPGQGDAYATFDGGGHLEHWPIRGRTFKRWLCRQFYSVTGKTPGSQSVQDALGVLEGQAIFDGECHDVAVRVGEHDGRIYFDLSDDNWRSVEIDAGGWRLMDRCPVYFRRAKAMLPLPVPEAGGSIDDLRRFVNVDDDGWPLVLGWLVAALRPSGPYPLLTLCGEQGSAKSTTARVLRDLVDPNTAPVRSEPREPRDLMIAAANGWLVALDNLSHVPGWLSDALCRLSTGGGFSCRTLYENDEETIFDAQRPGLMTGIEELGTRADLLDRSLIVALPRIAQQDRRPESVFWPTFEAVRPKILGAILDAVAVALRDVRTVKIDSLPRMADFALWATAAEPGLGLQPGAFMRAYAENRETAHAQALESCPIVCYLLDLGDWTGTPSELLTKIDSMASDSDKRLKNWPKTPRALGGMLRRVAPDLRTSGLDVTFGREPGGQRRRFVTLTRTDRDSTGPTEPSVPDPQKTADFRDGGRDGRDGSGTDRDANVVDVNPDGTTGGTVRDGRDGEKQSCSSWSTEGRDDDVVRF